MTAAFFNAKAAPPHYEVYAAIGRPGEPVPLGGNRSSGRALGADGFPTNGVSFVRFTSSDLVSWSAGTVVLFLENGSGKNASSGENDGAIWTIKSMDRDGDERVTSDKVVKCLVRVRPCSPIVTLCNSRTQVRTTHSLTHSQSIIFICDRSLALTSVRSQRGAS